MTSTLKSIYVQTTFNKMLKYAHEYKKIESCPIWRDVVEQCVWWGV